MLLQEADGGRRLAGIGWHVLLMVALGLTAAGSRGMAADLESRMKALDAAFEAGVLTRAEYERKKAAWKAKGAAAVNRKATRLTEKDLAPARTKGKIYRHPTGVSFWYPADWRLVETEGIIQLIPPGATTDGGNFESYFLTGERVAEEGITQVTDPRVTAYLDEQMSMLGAQLGVAFQRQGAPESLTTSAGKDRGIRLKWTAQSALGPVDAYAMATILRGYGLVVAGVGVKGLAAKRAPIVDRIFSSFGVGEGRTDAALVGTWQLTGTYAVQNDSAWESSWSKAKSASETKSTLHLNSDGTWTRDDQFTQIAGAGGIWLENNEKTHSEGRWNADAGRLFLLWKDHSFADYHYRIANGELHLLADGKGQTWHRVR